jgi:hypothetical protein
MGYSTSARCDCTDTPFDATVHDPTSDDEGSLYARFAVVFEMELFVIDLQHVGTLGGGYCSSYDSDSL